MSMMDLVQILEQHGKGVRAYIECIRIINERLGEGGKTANAYFLLRSAANKFVESYEDQPLLSAHAEEAFDYFKSYVESLSQIENSDDAAANFETLNQVAGQIAGHKLTRPSM